MIICMQQVCDLWIFEHKTLASQGLDIDEIVKKPFTALFFILGREVSLQYFTL